MQPATRISIQSASRLQTLLNRNIQPVISEASHKLLHTENSVNSSDILKEKSLAITKTPATHPSLFNQRKSNFSTSSLSEQKSTSSLSEKKYVSNLDELGTYHRTLHTIIFNILKNKTLGDFVFKQFDKVMEIKNTKLRDSIIKYFLDKPGILNIFLYATTFDEAIDNLVKDLKANKGIILDYSPEKGNEVTDEDIRIAMKNLFELADRVYNSTKGIDTGEVSLALKASSFATLQSLEEISSNAKNITGALEENCLLDDSFTEIKTVEDWANHLKLEGKFRDSFIDLSNNFLSVCKEFHEKDITIFLDAEYNKTLEAEYILGLMAKSYFPDIKFHPTIQCYRKDARGIMEFFNKNNTSVKLVRGAYMEHENKLAKKNNSNSPICETKEKTDNQYNELLEDYSENIKIAATHNSDSAKLAIDKQIPVGVLKGIDATVDPNSKHTYAIITHNKGEISSVVQYFYRRLAELLNNARQAIQK